MCADPVNTQQLPDLTNHVHTLVITATALNAGAPMMVSFDTGTTNNHLHAVMLTAGDITMLRAGMAVTKMSAPGGGNNHTHMYEILCS